MNNSECILEDRQALHRLLRCIAKKPRCKLLCRSKYIVSTHRLKVQKKASHSF